MKKYGARGALSDPPQLGEYVVALAWEAEAAIAAARADMLAKCIAAVEDLHPKHCFPSDHPYQMRRAAVAALRNLQEKP